jgi:hypothetical protein
LKKNDRFAASIIKSKTSNMKKVFAILALAGVMVSCNNKKAEDKKPADDTTKVTTDNTTTDNTTTTNTNYSSDNVPTFKDAEVQQFANDYAAFVKEYKAGLKDPAKLADLSAKMQDWGTRAQSIGQKLANDVEEARKWTEFVTACSKEMSDAAMNMGK